MKKYFYLLILFLAGGTYLFFDFSRVRNISKLSNITKAEKNILAECVQDEKAKIHYHAQLKIIFLGENYPIPAKIGLYNNCAHPIQTHDDQTGQIHIHSYKNYPFTIGDFFSTWGIIFNNNQIGGTFAGERYKFVFKVNGKKNKEFEKYVLKSNDKIEITITQKL